jgi:DMSO/TMAO reductase YedYZ molybdopterin-dependent catalytic subunit
MPDNPRPMPPGQTPGWGHRCDLGIHPPFDPATWDLRVEGLVANPLRLTWPDFLALPRTRRTTDLHCVEGWTIPDVDCEGVLVADVVRAAAPTPEARFVFLSSADGYSTSLPADRAPDVLFATAFNGAPIADIDGGPIQLVVPDLYAYKWAKWVRVIEFLAEDRLGYWEERGYSNTADVWTNDRRA